MAFYQACSKETNAHLFITAATELVVYFIHQTFLAIIWRMLCAITISMDLMSALFYVSHTLTSKALARMFEFIRSNFKLFISIYYFLDVIIKRLAIMWNFRIS